MPKYISNAVSIEAIQMEEEFVFTNIDGTYDGETGDYIVSIDGDPCVIPQKLFEKLFIEQIIN